ncbi:tRNA 2-selenouridine(34) synthase MnmH [Dinoroseobacter sp. PD6]|uniref:tRNA 2-selenouridine(34) synthase MnmH n=1 Tax=Dinoroseobacter sp. PD6 TaxID=3028384 RepID=UPI00237B80DC|nr:tRNA 2-selenouridine(34) synthase MnmH [Dinoroseobacter sp. PD6]MDD9717796.1 tRNA 2-selenouridine(34) synthase MnmH [Dinoroseobacter sp. PD6]
MPIALSSLPELTDLPHDEIIDVRSPAEFAEDHVPGAVNLPVLSNAERAEVGTVYVQDSPFKARKMGAALVARNAARHLETHLADKPGAYRPLVYCWRGGQRSGSFAAILQQIGWRAETLQGGYRSYRRLVNAALYDAEFPCPIVLLDGDTGSGKTDILNLLPGLGWQVLDLEGMAHHRGSLLGAYAEDQPAQKGFESALAMALAALNPARPVVVEAESSKIGRINLPPALWSAMRQAPRLVLSVPRAERARYLTRSYGDLLDQPEEMAARLNPLRKLHGHAQVDAWQEMAAAGAFEALAEGLMAVHYDPLYRRGRKGAEGRDLALGNGALAQERMAETAALVSQALAAVVAAR